MSDARNHIIGFGTIEVVGEKKLSSQRYAVTYKVHSHDPRALELISKACKSLDKRRFDCTNKDKSTIEIHAISNGFQSFMDADHPFNSALFSALENLVNPSSRGNLLRLF